MQVILRKIPASNLFELFICAQVKAFEFLKHAERHSGANDFFLEENCQFMVWLDWSSINDTWKKVSFSIFTVKHV